MRQVLKKETDAAASHKNWQLAFEIFIFTIITGAVVVLLATVNAYLRIRTRVARFDDC